MLGGITCEAGGDIGQGVMSVNLHEKSSLEVLRNMMLLSLLGPSLIVITILVAMND